MKIVKLSSKNGKVIPHILEKGYWPNNSMPAKASVGDTVYVVPNAEQRDRGVIMCVKGTLSKAPYRDLPSEKGFIKPSTVMSVYVCELEDIELISYYDVPINVRTTRVSMNGIAYVS